MNYKVVVSEQAERDLKGIYSYIYCGLKSKSSAKKNGVAATWCNDRPFHNAQTLPCISVRTLAFKRSSFRVCWKLRDVLYCKRCRVGSLDNSYRVWETRYEESSLMMLDL